MKTATFNIAMKNGTKEVREGYIVNGIYGIDKRDGGFYLTHLPTGVLVTNSRTRKALMELANRSDMTDQNDFTVMANAVKDFWDRRWWKD